jgi:ankyrin repeat protein
MRVGVDVNYIEKTEGRTTLFFAVAAQSMDIIERLLKMKADPSIVTFTGVQALDYALAPRAVELKCNLDIVLKLIENGGYFSII